MQSGGNGLTLKREDSSDLAVKLAHFYQEQVVSFIRCITCVAVKKRAVRDLN